MNKHETLRDQDLSPTMTEKKPAPVSPHHKKQRVNLIILRYCIQTSFTLFCLFIGFRFYQYYQWITGHSSHIQIRPSAVEAFLPIGALVSLKKLIITGTFDVIHPAGLTIFITAITIAFLARKGFCGWVCPVGFVSTLAAKAGKKFKTIQTTPFWVDAPLLSLKYILLFFFSYLILWKMDIQSIESFIRSPYNVIVDAKMLDFFLDPSNTTLGIFAFLTVISFFLRNFWCRFLCPYGALLGLFSLLSPFRVKRQISSCIDCKKCEGVCPGSIKITANASITTPECIGCLECVQVCPVSGCLSTKFLHKDVPSISLPIIVIGLILGLWLWALGTGHWHQQIPEELLRKYYHSAMSIGH